MGAFPSIDWLYGTLKMTSSHHHRIIIVSAGTPLRSHPPRRVGEYAHAHARLRA